MKEQTLKDIDKAFKALEDRDELLVNIRAEVERQEKWLSQAGYNAYNVNIAFGAIKHLLAESEE